MAKKSLYGIQSVKLMKPGENGAFADFSTLVEGTNGLTINAIAKDSFSFSDTAPSTTDLDVEDMDLHYATLNSDSGTRQFTFQSYDMSETAVKFLLGYTEKTVTSGSTSTKWYEAPVTNSNQIFSAQVLTRKLDDIPATCLQWAKLKVEITKAGTLGKSGLPNFTFTCTEIVNLNSDNQGVTNHRFMFVEED